MFISDPGSATRFFTHPGSRIRGSKKHWIPHPYPQFCLYCSCPKDFCCDPYLGQDLSMHFLHSSKQFRDPVPLIKGGKLLRARKVILFLCSGSSLVTWRTTSGRWATPGPAVPAQRFTSTESEAGMPHTWYGAHIFITLNFFWFQFQLVRRSGFSKVKMGFYIKLNFLKCFGKLFLEGVCHLGLFSLNCIIKYISF